MTYAEYLEEVNHTWETVVATAPSYRWGQCLFNCLPPDIAAELPPELDPYYKSSNIPFFLDWVKTRLPE